MDVHCIMCQIHVVFTSSRPSEYITVQADKQDYDRCAASDSLQLIFQVLPDINQDILLINCKWFVHYIGF